MTCHHCQCQKIRNRKVIAGNWKMNGDKASNKILLETVLASYEKYNKIDWIVLAPFVYVSQCEKLLDMSHLGYGAQDISENANGAFTGDISAGMLKDFGCHYVLTGHSERRHGHGETNELVAKKTKTALEAEMIPILCVGETLEEREANQTLTVVSEQLKDVLNLVKDPAVLSKMIIAYEPVWAIGTGKVATPEQAQEVHAAIRHQLKQMDQTLGAKMQILYGGSVKPDNAESLFKMPDIDGALIGGASLKAEQFLKIGEICNQFS